jgi:tetratricopeptide (TPR) repeat protein
MAGMRRLLMLGLAIALPLHLAAAGPAEDAQALENQAASLYREGRYSDAEPLYRDVLALFEQARGADSADVARVLFRLGLVYDRQGRYGQSEPVHKRALAIAETTDSTRYGSRSC